MTETPIQSAGVGVKDTVSGLWMGVLWILETPGWSDRAKEYLGEDPAC
jgi:hypothetical protein